MSSKLSLFSAPIHESLIPDAILDELYNFDLMRECLSLLSAHHSLFLLKNSISKPRLNYLLRCTPCGKHLDSLQLLDDCLKSSLEDLLKCKILDSACGQTTLPVCIGGMRFRKTTELDLLFYLASVHSCPSLVNSPTLTDKSQKTDKKGKWLETLLFSNLGALLHH